MFWFLRLVTQGNFFLIVLAIFTQYYIIPYLFNENWKVVFQFHCSVFKKRKSVCNGFFFEVIEDII